MSDDSFSARAAAGARQSRPKRIGRGAGSGLGKTCGKGKRARRLAIRRQLRQAPLPGRSDADPASPAEARLPRAVPDHDGRASTWRRSIASKRSRRGRGGASRGSSGSGSRRSHQDPRRRRAQEGSSP